MRNGCFHFETASFIFADILLSINNINGILSMINMKDYR